jgi:hypothetical protein
MGATHAVFFPCVVPSSHRCPTTLDSPPANPTSLAVKCKYVTPHNAEIGCPLVQGGQLGGKIRTTPANPLANPGQPLVGLEWDWELGLCGI